MAGRMDLYLATVDQCHTFCDSAKYDLAADTVMYDYISACMISIKKNRDIGVCTCML